MVYVLRKNVNVKLVGLTTAAGVARLLSGDNLPENAMLVGPLRDGLRPALIEGRRKSLDKGSAKSVIAESFRGCLYPAVDVYQII